MLDAYAVRKAVPRVVLAVIGINISIYVCLAVVDIVNVIAGGIARLLVTPFATAGMTVFDQPTDMANSIAGGAGVAVAAGPMTAAVTGLAGAIAAGEAMTVLGSLLFLLIPIAFLALAIVITVVIRQALLLFLIIISPVAIACYVLPGTEKYFQQWWDLFLKTLMVYPIIAVIFALSDVFASVIMSTNAGGVTGLAKTVTTIVVIYAPLFLIPFAFKFAGGALGKIAGVAGGLADRAGKSGFVKARQEHYGNKYKAASERAKIEAYRRNMETAGQLKNSTSGFDRARGRTAAWRAGRLTGYKNDILEREAKLNEEAAKETNFVTNNGDDALIRAYTVDKRTAKRQVGEDGQMQYMTAGGKWVNESDVDEAERRFGKRNMSQYQQSLAYEQKKAITQEQQDNLVTSFGNKMDSWGASGNEANGAWIGAGFANQEKNRQWKHARWSNTDENGNKVKFNSSTGGQNLITEVDENIGSYQGSQANADTWTTMAQQVMASKQSRDESQQAVRTLMAKPSLTLDERQELRDHQKNIVSQEDTLHRASRIASSLRTVHQPRNENGEPIGEPVETIGAGAAPRAQEEMRAYVDIADQFAGKYKPQEKMPGPVTEREAGNTVDSYNARSHDRK